MWVLDSELAEHDRQGLNQVGVVEMCAFLENRSIVVLGELEEIHTTGDELQLA